jgi:hypothetical protein
MQQADLTLVQGNEMVSRSGATSGTRTAPRCAGRRLQASSNDLLVHFAVEFAAKDFDLGNFMCLSLEDVAGNLPNCARLQRRHRAVGNFDSWRVMGNELGQIEAIERFARERADALWRD